MLSLAKPSANRAPARYRHQGAEAEGAEAEGAEAEAAEGVVAAARGLLCKLNMKARHTQ